MPSIRIMPTLFAVASLSLAACSPETPAAEAATAKPSDQTPITAQSPVQRGKYLVQLGGCHDCHSPKAFGPQGPAPDTTRLLSGHPSGDVLPPVPKGIPTMTGWVAAVNAHSTAWAGPWGTTYSSNLTPHATGLGGWTAETFIQTMRTGKHMGTGRPVMPPMPWESLGRATDDDLRAIFAYLQSLPPVENAVPAPVPPVAMK